MPFLAGWQQLLGRRESHHRRLNLHRTGLPLGHLPVRKQPPLYSRRSRRTAFTLFSWHCWAGLMGTHGRADRRFYY